MKGVTCSLSVLCVFIPLSSSRALLPSLPPSPLSSSPACTGPSYPAAFAGGRRDRLGGRSRTSTETAAERTCSQRWAYSQSPEGRGAMNAAIRGGLRGVHCRHQAGGMVAARRGSNGCSHQLDRPSLDHTASHLHEFSEEHLSLPSGPHSPTPSQPHTFMNSPRNSSLFPNP